VLVTDAQGNPVTEASKPDVYNVPGIGLVQVDPTKPAGQNSTVIQATPKGMTVRDLGAAATKEINGQVWVAQDGPDGQIVWQQAKDDQGNPLPANVQYTLASNDPRSSVIQLIGSDGSSKTIKKEDFHPPPSPAAGQALTPDTTAPYIVTIGEDGKPVFTDNRNQLSIQDATRQFIEGLGYHVAAGTMSEAQAQDLIKNITSNMTAQANMLQGGVTAASEIARAAQQGAQTGAGILQNRVTAATGALQNLVGLAAGAKNLMSAPAGLGEQLVGGLQGWATELGGGQGVYDAAANLVKNADPQNQSGMASQGYAALQQMLQKYTELTGQQHPAVDMVRQQAGLPTGFNAPLTSFQVQQTTNPFAGLPGQNSTAALNAAGMLDNPATRAGIPPGPPPGSNYGANVAYTGGGAPWNYFLAPVTVAPPPATVVV
jgi:hypothetical protein